MKTSDTADVAEDLRRQPFLLMQLMQNAFNVAATLRGGYFKNTATFVGDLRRRIRRQRKVGDDVIMQVDQADSLSWAALGGEVVTFIDGGVGNVEIASTAPLLLRVGSYCVKTGERRLSEREKFGYYPIVLGDLEGGSRDRKDFIDIVRITAELLGGLSALERTHDLRMLMFHGPLVYTVGHYTGHSPFTEGDVDLFLQHYAGMPSVARDIKDEFLSRAAEDVYPRMVDHSEWAAKRLFEPLAFMSYLYGRLIRIAGRRDPVPLVVGVVERGENLSEFIEDVLLARVFQSLRRNGNERYFVKMFEGAADDLVSPKAILNRLNYSDPLLLAMVLEPGEYSEPWSMKKFEGLNRASISVPGQPGRQSVDFGALRPTAEGFPAVVGSYLHVSRNTLPIRIEVFKDLGAEQVAAAASRVYLYSRLLPGYGFPIGLDIADKYAHVPQWLTDAYGKLIRHHLGVSLQRGEIGDAETRRLIVQAMYITHRDFLFRPDV